MKYIDLESYPRRSHYEFFRAMAYPYVGMTANVEVTNLVRYAKSKGGSPFLACLWAASHAVNAVPEMRQRMVGDRIVQYEYCCTSHTEALPDGTFCNCLTDTNSTLDEYLVSGKACQLEARTHHGFQQQLPDPTGLIFASCVPWVAFTQVVQPVPIPADSNPRIVMGKFIRTDAQIQMPLNIQCNHALVDGRHIGDFFRNFEEIHASFAND